MEIRERLETNHRCRQCDEWKKRQEADFWNVMNAIDEYAQVFKSNSSLSRECRSKVTDLIIGLYPCTRAD